MANELTCICYHMLRASTEFNGRFKGIELGRSKKLERPAGQVRADIRPLFERILRCVESLVS